MTNQEIFDKVKAHLLKQNAKSLAADGWQCLYRDAQGNKCAIGCLIPDEVYDPALEGKFFTSLPARVLDVVRGETVDPADDFEATGRTQLLCALQMVHDRYSVQDWDRQLQQVASEFNLQVSR